MASSVVEKKVTNLNSKSKLNKENVEEAKMLKSPKYDTGRLS